MEKIAFFDIDGTLLDCKSGIMNMKERVRNSIRKFQSKGNKAIVSTGRPYAFLSSEILEFGFDGFILGNGGRILLEDKTVYVNAIKKEFVEFIVRNCEEMGIEYCLQTEKYTYIKKECKEMLSYYDGYRIDKKFFIYDFDFRDLDVFKIEMFPMDEKGIEFCKSIDDYEEYHYFRNYPAKAYELYPVSNSKGEGIKKIAEYTGIDIEDTYAFGDARNDIEMIETAGHGIAMGNAGEYLKEIADEITLSVSEDGVAHYIENKLL